AWPQTRRAFLSRPERQIELIALRSGPTDLAGRAVPTVPVVARIDPLARADSAARRRSVAPTARAAAGPTDSAGRTAVRLVDSAAGRIVRIAASPAAAPVPPRADGARSVRA